MSIRGARRLTAIMRSKKAVSVSATSARAVKAALLTSASSPPKQATAAAASSAGHRSSARSPVRNAARSVPSSRRRLSPRAASRP